MRHRFSALVLASALSCFTVSVPGISHAVQSGQVDGPRKSVSVTSDTMEAKPGENMVVFRGNVSAVEDFTLCSDELSIIYDSNKDINEIEALGNVRIFQGEKTSTAGRAVYNRKERLIVLTGEPEVAQCADVVKGEKITVYLDDNNAVVESGGGKRVRAVIMPDKKCPGKMPERNVREEALCSGAR